MSTSVVPKHDHATLNFPEGFLWGTATSAYQVEGNNIHSDWWAWESRRDECKHSGPACDQYNRFEEDFDLIKSFSQNAHRLSLEWSRIEPKEGQFDFHEIEHYKIVLKTLRDKGIKVMLTLHHFTNPLWTLEKGGWENGQTSDYFARYVKTIAPELKDLVDFWITINEPGIYSYMAYTAGLWPPQKKSKLATMKVTWNMASAHKKAYKILHSLDGKIPIGVAQNVQTYESYHKHDPIEQMAVLGADIIANHSFYLLTRGYHDFLGINYYFHHRLNRGKGLIPKVVDVTKFSKDISDLGWEIYPQGIFSILTDLSDHLPIYITECGIATSNDDRRIRFLTQYLQEVYRAIQAGVDVRGFFYWSLLDNFEWHEGLGPKFGLMEVDFKTQKRTPRPSAYIYKDIVERNGIRHDLMKFLGHRVHADEVIDIPGIGKIS